MPTENRSSNTDPRDVFIRLNPLGLGEAELRKDSTGFEDQRTHSDYLLFLAGYRETHPEPLQHTEQHQGEPVAYAVFTDNGNIRIWSTNCAAVAIKVMQEEGKQVVPLYAHSAPSATAEVERLRTELDLRTQERE